MKKLLLASIIASMTTVAAAAEVLVINPQARTSPVATLAMTVQKNIEGSQYFQGESCQSAVDKYHRTENSLLVYGTNLAITGLRKNNLCDTDIRADNIIFYSEQYYQICTKRGSGKTFRTPNAALGMASVQPVAAIVADINQQNGTSLRPLPFAGSRDVLLQVLSGDLDLGLIGTSTAANQERQGTIECLASTDPRDAKFWGKTLKMKQPDIRIQTLILHNIKDPQLVEQVRKGINSDEVRALLNKGNYSSITTVGSQAIVDLAKNYIKRSHDNYGKDKQ
jgi:hypothetical protein